MMNDRRFGGGLDRLRDPERVARMEVPRVVELCLEGQSIRSVNDVGTGSGIFAEAFAAQGLAVMGVDIREDMVAAAKAYVPEGDFRLGTMEANPFPDKSADLVFMGHVLHEADTVEVALREALRVSRLRVAALEWPYKEEDAGPPLAHRLNPAAVLEAARELGFVAVEGIPLGQMVLYRMECPA
jgi:ubiquinone/menaquinone biosynthesis C-methylase UbiE